jgi:glycosyltransferase involved in cell wall biosynthesis
MGRGKSLASVTVVIPVWDHYVGFLEEAVKSARANVAEARVIVVDNASEVPVPELDGVTTLRSPSRLSIGAARNLGIQHVQTPYVLNLDADDRLLPGALEFMLSELETDPSLSVCAMSIMEDGGRRHRTPRRFVSRLVLRPALFAVVDSIWSLLPIGCALLRTEQVREAGGYADAEWGEDWVLAISLVFRGRVEVSHQFGRFYRLTENSLSESANRHRELVSSARLVRKRIRADRGVPRWARAALPGIALLQMAAIWVARPAYRAIGRIGPRIGSPA